MSFWSALIEFSLKLVAIEMCLKFVISEMIQSCGELRVSELSLISKN